MCARQARKPGKPTMAEQADIHELYEESVQNVEHEIEFLSKTFKEVTGVTGIVLTKLDGTAKGGMVLSVTKETDVPIRFVGVGETIDDLRPFDAESFASALF